MSFPVFNAHTNDSTPQPYTFWGQSGTWFTLPLNWYCRTNANGTVTASPNGDFSSPTYSVSMNADGTMVIQDLLRARGLGLA